VHFRNLGVVGFFIAVVACFGLLGSAASAATANQKVKVQITDAKQNSLTGPGLKIKLRSNRAGKVKVSFTVKTFDRNSATLAKTRRVALKKGKPRNLRVKLLASQRTAAASCGVRTIQVTVQSGKKKTRRTAQMVRQRSDCKPDPVDLSRAEDCDWIAQPKEGLCLMPFPNDYYTRRDADSPTGKRLAFTAAGMPQNIQEVPIDPTPYGESDGFSQGQGIILKVPGVETPESVEANGFVTLQRLSRHAEPNQKAVVIDTKSGKRWPIWVGVDEKASDPRDASLMISPAENFREKGRYVVALRNLVDPQGKKIEAPNAFRYFRDQLPSSQKAINDRRNSYEGIFKTLRKAGIKRSELYLAWDFTVASNENNYRRALHMRDEAFAELGDTTMADRKVDGRAPEFVVERTAVSGETIRLPDNSTRTIPNDVARYVAGTYTVPCFLTGGIGSPCASGGTMDLDDRGLPKRFGDYEANFECIIPSSVLEPGGGRARPFIYGHGLLGASAEVVFSQVSRRLASEHKMIGCATDEIGMAAQDLAVTVIPALTELSNFPKLADRLQQGLLTELFLARVMFHPDGFRDHPAFRSPQERATIRTDEVFYVGASQGGIMGGALTAISPDFTQSGLMVGAMNYSTLLTRSSNWRTYGLIFNNSYLDELARPLILNIIQNLWDRGEPNGYAHVMTENPPPNTPEHRILKLIALGDHQVTNFASDVQARSVAGVKTPAGGIDDRRWPNYEDLWNIPRIKASEYPYRGSAIVYFDGGPPRKNPGNLSQTIGTVVPPYGNVAPDSRWEDPHGAPRNGEVGPVELLNDFLNPDGFITDFCSGSPCLGSGWDGNYEAIIAP
jgi:hypothetical protein